LSTNLVNDAGTVVTLSEDKKSVILTLENGANLVNFSTKNKVTVSKVVGLSDDYTTESVSVQDAAFPTFESVTASGPRELTIVFSEPVNAASTSDAVNSLSLNSGAISLDPTSAVFIPSENKLIVNTYSDLTEGSHTLAVKTGSANLLTDFAGAKVVPATKTFTYTKDVTAPTFTVKSSTENTVTLKFNKNVSNVNSASVRFSHTYKGSNELAGNTGGVVTQVTPSEYTISFAGTNPFPPGTAKVYVDYVTGTSDANKIKDNYGNVLAPVAFDVTTVADVVKPEVSTVEFINATTLKVTFSETVLAGTGVNGSENTANYKLTEADGKTAIAVSGASLDSTGKVVTLTTGTINGGNPILTVKKIKDRSIAANEITEASKQFAASDKVAPTVVDLNTLNSAGTLDAQLLSNMKVKITFSEAMNVASITNKDNYLFGTAALDSKVKITAASDNKSVVLDFTDVVSGPQTTLASGTIKVGRVADAAGNLIEAFSTTVDVPSAITAPLFDSAEVVNKNQVKLYFNEVVTGLTASDLAVAADGSNFEKVTSVSTTVADGKTTVLATIAGNIAPAAAAAVKVQSVANSVADATTQASASNGKNAYGVAVNVTATVADDAFAPELITTDAANTLDVNNDGQIDHITLTFTENLAAGTISTDKFTVEGYEVLDAYSYTSGSPAYDGRSTAVVGNDDFVVVRVKQKTTTDVDATPTVTIKSGLTDVYGNAFVVPASGIKATDAILPVAPSLTGVSITDATGSTVNGQSVVNLPTAGTGNSFKYLVSSGSSAVPTPRVGDDVSAWLTVANGDTITVANGKDVGVAEVNASNQVVKFVNVVAANAGHVAATSAVKTADAAVNLTTDFTANSGSLVVNTVDVDLTNVQLLNGSTTPLTVATIITALQADLDAVYNGTLNGLVTFTVEEGTAANAGKLVIKNDATGSTSTVDLTGSTVTDASALGFTTLTGVNGANSQN
jgi:hypothetical protein